MNRRSGASHRLAAAALASLAFVPSPGAAWTPATQRAIARSAAAVAPPDLARQLERHRQELERGVVEAFRDGDPARHERNPEGGRLDAVIAAEASRAIEWIRGLRPFTEVVRQLGRLSHYVADANNPLNAAAADPAEVTYYADYWRYVETAQGRFAVVFYGLDRDLAAPAAGRIATGSALEPLITRALDRGRELYPLIGREVARLRSAGASRPGPAFDDRSTAFGVATVAFNQAVTDVAVVLRFVWLAAGGADERRTLPERGSGRLVALPGVAAAH